MFKDMSTSEVWVGSVVTVVVLALLALAVIGGSTGESNARNREAACMTHGGYITTLGDRHICLQDPAAVDSLPNWRQ